MSEFEKDSAGIFLPTPNQKEMRILCFEGGQTLQVAESMDEVADAIDEGRRVESKWIDLHSGMYGNPMRVPMRAFDRLMWIDIAWVDMEAAKYQMTKQRVAQRMPGLAGPGELGVELLANRQQRRNGGRS